MNSFFVALNAVVPFLIYISFGYVIRMSKLVDEDFMKKMNQLVFKAFFPIMMFHTVYKNEEYFHFNTRLIPISIVSVLLTIFLLVLIVPHFVKENPKRSVIIQAVYRSNFVLFAIPLTENVFGAKGSAVAAMMVSIIVPLYNIAAVALLESYRGGKIQPAQLLWKVLQNPLILGTLVGFLFIGLKITLPDCILKPVSQFANLSTPLALFILGGTLRFSSMSHHMKYILPSMGVKLILLPALAIAAALLFGFNPAERFVYFTMFATPVAASSYPMAENMGGDGPLAGEFVVFSTAMSVVTIFLWIFFLNTAGLL